jgi:hypothetical protein
MSARRITPLVGRWLQVLRDMPVLPDVPRIAPWIVAQRVEIKSKENPTYSGQFYDFDRCPAVKNLVFAFFEDPSARELFCLKPVQTMLTTACFFAVAHTIIYDPGNIIYVMDTRDKAREKLRDNLKPIYAQIADLGRGDESAAGDEDTATAIRFAGGVLYIGGGHSSAALNSTPAQVVVLDEAERHKFLGGTSTISLARDRVTGSENSKIIAFSKPEREARFEDGKYVTEEDTVLHSEYLTGDRRKYFCPCIHCGVRQEVLWENIRFHHCNETLRDADGKAITEPMWNKARVKRETYYRCPHCEGHIHEGEEKRRFIEAGEWQATAPGHPGRWSAQFSALVDIAFESLRWENLALRWIDAQGDPGKLRAFWNAILGLPESQTRSADTTHAHLLALIPPPGSNDPPRWRLRHADGSPSRIIPLLRQQIDFIGMACDVQQGHIKFVTRAFMKDGRSLLIDYGRLPDLPDIRLYLDETHFETLDRDGNIYRVWRCYVDTGYRTFDVYDLCLSDERIDGIRGEGVEVRYRGDGEAWVWPCNTKCGHALFVIYMAANHWERQLYVERIQRHDPKRHRPHAPAIHLPEDIGDDYMHELTGMQEVRNAKGRPVWKKLNAQTVVDYGDCEKMLLVMEWNEGERHQKASVAPPKEEAAA